MATVSLLTSSVCAVFQLPLVKVRLEGLTSPLCPSPCCSAGQLPLVKVRLEGLSVARQWPLDGVTVTVPLGCREHHRIGGRPSLVAQTRCPETVTVCAVSQCRW